MPSPADRPTAALIDLDALEHNFKEVTRLAGGRKILAVVKAGAYGHGAVEISRRLLGLGADMLGVALVEEGGELREAGIEAPILVMGALFPEQAEAVVSLHLTPAVFTIEEVRALSEAAVKRGTTVSVHVKIDTGMGRIGIAPEEAPRLIADMRGFKGVDVRG
jgi:alanine racemase